MVSLFLIVVATLSVLQGARFLGESALDGTVSKDELLVSLLFWTICAVCFGAAAVGDVVKSATRRMIKKLDELAGKAG